MAPAPVLPATSIYWAGPGVPDSSVDPELTRKEVQQFVDKVATEIGATVPEVTVSVVKGGLGGRTSQGLA